ncbi:ATP-binding protein [Leptolyngbya sp. DQ-M1]|uniref:ATP-binding protein n=1 Tax=Leptolyngbya sp. DQ-M1 TaxID=2933920 RepID=UPI003299655A
MPETRVVFYQDEKGEAPVLEWFKTLLKQDRKGYANCVARIQRLADAGYELRRPAADYLRTIQSWTEQEKLWIAVQDTGIGIASEDLPFVFQRFWRSEHSRSLRCEGSGIGLAVTERLVRVMGGWIEVESELNRGTTFRFCLPTAMQNKDN